LHHYGLLARRDLGLERIETTTRVLAVGAIGWRGSTSGGKNDRSHFGNARGHIAGLGR
jgi:hypothetical protein